MRQLTGFIFASLVMLVAADFGIASQKYRVLCVGDSLTEGYGLSKASAYPAQLEVALHQLGLANVEVVNAGSSGATTASGISTLRFHFKRRRPNMVIYGLGSNDGLRGVRVSKTKENIDSALSFIKEAEVPVLLLGLKAPPNYGRKFPKEFENIFPEMQKKHRVPMLPFMLGGVAGQKSLNLPDGIHPNKAGYKIIVANLLPFVKEIYKSGHSQNK